MTVDDRNEPSQRRPTLSQLRPTPPLACGPADPVPATPVPSSRPHTDLGEGAQSPEVMPQDWGFKLIDERDIFLTRIAQHGT